MLILAKRFSSSLCLVKFHFFSASSSFKISLQDPIQRSFPQVILAPPLQILGFASFVPTYFCIPWRCMHICLQFVVSASPDFRKGYVELSCFYSAPPDSIRKIHLLNNCLNKKLQTPRREIGVYKLHTHFHSKDNLSTKMNIVDPE